MDIVLYKFKPKHIAHFLVLSIKHRNALACHGKVVEKGSADLFQLKIGLCSKYRAETVQIKRVTIVLAKTLITQYIQ